jgi:hypothetical protein
MCNSLNHHPSCTCGFGGVGHLGRRINGDNMVKEDELTNYRRTVHPCDLDSKQQARQADYVTFKNHFVNPNATCPICGKFVYFYQSENGGRVFFDELGHPWTKHPCTDKSQNRKVSIGNLQSKPFPSMNWKKEGWRPFWCFEASLIQGRFTKLGCMTPKRSFFLYIENFDIPLSSIQSLPIQFKSINTHCYHLSTFVIVKNEHEFESVKREYMAYDDLQLANFQKISKKQADKENEKKLKRIKRKKKKKAVALVISA